MDWAWPPADRSDPNSNALKKDRAPAIPTLTRRLLPPVMIVIDDAHVREMYVATLALLRFEAVGVEHPSHAFALAWRNHPDIIVVELTRRDSERWGLSGRQRTNTC